jgi:glycosyltransferase involved in cell wall biosynthesis
MLLLVEENEEYFYCKNMNQGISVIICCYNSGERLLNTLKYLAEQRISPEIPVEIVLVNNASSDNTKETAQSEWQKYQTSFLFKIVDEMQAGLIFARRKGIETASYKYVVFCDDDNWLRNDYLQNAHNLMEANPNIGVLGGQSEGVSNIDFPAWFDDFKYCYAIGKQSEQNGNISHRKYIWGAGMVARRFLMDKVFDPSFPFLLFGRKGNTLLAGDDSEVCRRVLLLGYDLFYHDSLFYYHQIPAARLTEQYRKKLFEGFTNAIPILVRYDNVIDTVRLSTARQLKEIFILFFKETIRFFVSRKKKDHLALRAKMAILFKNRNFIQDEEYHIVLDFYFTEMRTHSGGQISSGV